MTEDAQFGEEVTQFEGYCKGCESLVISESRFCEDCGTTLMLEPSDIPSRTPRADIVDRVKAAIRASEQPFLSTTGIGERLGVTRQTAHNYHEELKNENSIGMTKVGNSYVYWIKDEG